MASRILWMIGSIFVGGAGLSHGDPLTCAAAFCFLLGVLCSFKEYE